MALVQNRFRGNGLYILDEPESALSPSRQMTMLVEIELLIKANSQVIIATHSPILLSYPGATIYEIVNGEITEVMYEDTEVYKMYKLFLDNHENILRHLFTE